jgi:hypothetical protein
VASDPSGSSSSDRPSGEETITSRPSGSQAVHSGSDSTRAITSLWPARSAGDHLARGPIGEIQPVPVPARRLHQAPAGQQRAYLVHPVTTFLPERSAKLSDCLLAVMWFYFQLAHRAAVVISGGSHLPVRASRRRCSSARATAFWVRVIA